MQNYNHIRDCVDITTTSNVVEKVTPQEVKNFLKQEGFIDDDDTTTIPDFTDDDDLFELEIVAARQRAEEFLCASIVSHTWRLLGVTNLAGNIRFPYGPVKEMTSIKNNLDEEIDDNFVTVIGDELKSPRFCDMTIEYDAGYNDLPAPIKKAIIVEVAYRYIHRGDEFDDPGMCKQAQNLLAPYKRKTWLVV